jgi:hypothetical protein
MKIKFRFSLRALLIAVTVIAVFVGWLESNIRAVAERRALSNAGVWDCSGTKASIPWMWSLLGETPVTEAYLADALPDETKRRLLAAFPEAEIHFVPDPSKIIGRGPSGMLPTAPRKEESVICP